METRGVRRLIPITVLALLAAGVVLSPLSDRGVTGEEATFCLGFIMIFAFFLASVLKPFHLPEISGYIIAGILCGSFVLNILSEEVVERLQVFDDIALAIIALIAGGEMRMSFLKRSKNMIGSVILGQVLFSFIAAMIVVFLLQKQLPFMADMGVGGVVAVGLALGAVTAARSPSTTIGVITEARAKGPYTDLTVGVTVILDVVVLVIVALLVPTMKALTIPDQGFSLVFAKRLFVELFGSIAAGIAFGAIVGAYIRWIGHQLPIFLVALGSLGSMLCRELHLEPLLAFMIAGFIVENFTALGERLIEALERSALPVYVIFFAISGASINLAALQAMWVFSLVLVVARAAAFYLGTLAASFAVPGVRPYASNLWMGLLSQAGVTIGIATVIESEFEWGSDLKTLILAVVAMNQLIGPVSLKNILVRRGEAAPD